MKTKHPFNWESHSKAPIVGIVRGLPLDTVISIANAYVLAGLSTIEITMNTTGASEIITEIRNKFPNLNVGAGTVCSVEDYNNAIAAGAQFIVTPVINEEVIKKAVADDVPIFPGAYSPSEIYKAWSLGASAVKIFPATQLGPTFVKDILAPLNNIKVLPTGGVTKENIASFFDAGATGVGMGSSLLNKELIKQNDFNGLAEHFKNIKAEIKAYL
ncbi:MULTISPECIES: bifunctional 4-hydroxy-2-oxoglutarate aldolase/2-dehydro-3-deoxy-phosphogluconate aldolase [unclassified Cellulophaga]|uniref:bifunctional 4-hydroxy-2-oxoglutarate aldolase/2-dehydro-3-deoxy-phosphogluconate aldolase n=1 Tax=unclassified Cellulophaga TaxID=2634405 RepID=UPI0026E46536|nr:MULTISPECIES: bifunctional 4-hydroxy-2-oxoglutarate aldolase/2-dehydro-3-deoxy-phosphogluconate aldolase [unclassified Cellulophaga]MDO6490214.1 bifunctional 4-hydroxy-2-oxoglutarate aldolase/2-dehydro-3-deoxy-phosphogluconate aldolase [Cellulophaga sp. 2_MG-2023]MDO6494592.1 bifunctional 4-hydroxy-2-oxoglutarate aldolase/2-dehydro-3-deoxy-phosphogluconate aldolase [Cellulophaga sp. 3_MG-2023]